MKNLSAIVNVNYDYKHKIVVVTYETGATRTYRGRVPFTVCDYIMEKSYYEGLNDATSFEPFLPFEGGMPF